MTKTELAKKAISATVMFGTGRIVYSILNNNVDESETLAQQVSVPVASFVIAGMATDATTRYTDHLVDEVVTWWHVNVKNA